jgi:hypothetical protein
VYFYHRFNSCTKGVGAILIAPLIAKFPTRSVLSGAILVFSLMTVILLIVDAGTGGKIKGSAAKTPHCMPPTVSSFEDHQS